MLNQNALDILKDDHDTIKNLFHQYEATQSEAYETKQWIAQHVFRELDLHSQLEEQIFYPAVRSARTDKGHELVLEGMEEHHVIDVLIEELRDSHPTDERYDAKFKVLGENVEHHIQEEEEELFPIAKQELGDRLDQLGDEMWRRKEVLMLAPQ
jgi:iron-sulfur cluster repair protein YtfE (RIC family)